MFWILMKWSLRSFHQPNWSYFCHNNNWNCTAWCWGVGSGLKWSHTDTHWVRLMNERWIVTEINILLIIIRADPTPARPLNAQSWLQWMCLCRLTWMISSECETELSSSCQDDNAERVWSVLLSCCMGWCRGDATISINSPLRKICSFVCHWDSLFGNLRYF